MAGFVCVASDVGGVRVPLCAHQQIDHLTMSIVPAKHNCLSFLSFNIYYSNSSAIDNAFHKFWSSIVALMKNENRNNNMYSSCFAYYNGTNGSLQNGNR